MGLAAKVPIIPSLFIKTMKKTDVISEKIMPAISPIATTTQMDDAAKRARSIYQRVNILIKPIVGAQCQNLSKG